MKSKGKDELLEFSSEESQSEDDEDGWMLTEEVEKEFYNTLTKIKNKDPKIYEKDVEFFRDVPKPENMTKKVTKKKPLTLSDYERKMIVEKGAEWSEGDSEVDGEAEEHRGPTYVEEQEELKRSFKENMNSISEDEGEDDDDEWTGLLKKREKSAEEKKKEEEEFEKMVKEQGIESDNAKEKEPIQDYWSNPELNEDDQFLRDYILNKKFLDKNDEDDTPVTTAQGSEPEEKCSHRFEEADQEFIKRYPRAMENSLRRKNENRKKKREEVKERKLKEKEKKKAEVKIKKKLKRQEIEEKLEELKKLTGNDQLENVLDQDFDIDEYDKAMQRLFSDEFYSQDDPNFKPSGTSLDRDDWTNEGAYEGVGENEEYENKGQPEEYGGVADEDEYLNCEDPNFNMDCDYDATLIKPKEEISRSRRRKDKHRRTTVSEVVSREKPTFDPTTHKSLQQYMDQYYAIDCEDFIGDLACRFKYRRTVANSYGLTVEEILTADEKELERWCSIKRINRIKPEFKEKGDLKVFQKKAADERLKRKILPSLYKKQEEEIENEAKVEKKEQLKKTTSTNDNATKKSSIEPENLNESGTNPIPEVNRSVKNKKPKKKKKKRKVKETTSPTEQEKVPLASLKRKLPTTDTDKRNKKRKTNDQHKSFAGSNSKSGKNRSQQNENKKEHSTLTEMSDARLVAYGIKPKKFRNKLKYRKDS